MSPTDEMAAALAPYREALQVDGADLELAGVDGDVAHVRLLVGPDTCADCILAKEMLETVLLDGFHACDERIAAVVLDDPRAGADS